MEFTSRSRGKANTSSFQVGKLTFDYDPQDGDDLDDDVDKWDDLALIILAIPWVVVFVVFVLYAIGIGMGAGGRVGTHTR